MKITTLIFLLLLPSFSSYAQRAIYLHSLKKDAWSSTFTFENPADSALLSITAGFRMPEGGGGDASFSIKPGVPDGTYYVYVDKDL